jgi:NADPH-dependent 2,4-dienoyl-CoA reductase/sulfur reductase-like enzyme/nitrite reductase/ring-hydroxylating ferredoxin subunit
MGTQQQASGPDFALGVPVADIGEGATLAGRSGDTPILLSRREGRFYAVEAACTHYGAPLSDGLVTGDRVRCPWHHACFNLRTGEAVAAPAFAPLQQWRAELEDNRVFVRAPQENAAPAPRKSGRHPGRIVIVGGGAAGFAAADLLRREGFSGALTMLSGDDSAPYDRPNLSKDYLAGTAPEDWIPLRDAAFYSERDIDLRLGAEVVRIDPGKREVTTRSGDALGYDALLLATGAAPVRLPTPGFEAANVHVLRTLADARALIDRSAAGGAVAIVGAGFIGLETAAALRARGLEVHVIAPDKVPLQRVLGAEVGAFVRGLHEAHGVRFHLGRTADAFDGRRLRLNDGEELAADFVIVGVGVRPNIQLAAESGLDVDAGVLVDAHMRTSAPHIFAAGDIARYPDPRTGERIRIEHWVAAQRQGQTAALNMLGHAAALTDAPFFWSAHYDASIRYVGHASGWDDVRIDGAIEAGDFTARYFRGGRLLAAASLGRDGDNLAIHEEMNAEAAA